jgi:hypothetical protein
MATDNVVDTTHLSEHDAKDVVNALALANQQNAMNQCAQPTVPPFPSSPPFFRTYLRTSRTRTPACIPGPSTAYPLTGSAPC